MRAEFILCAAVKRNNPEDCVKHYHNNDIYQIELGYRHCDIYARFGEEVSKNHGAQGFYTSRGRFVDRQEAFMIAYHAGQIPILLYDERGDEGKLFSEDLY